MTKKTPEQWLMDPQFNNIESVDFTRCNRFFDGKPDEPMDETTFRTRLKMANVRYRTKIFEKIVKEVRAHQVDRDIIVRTGMGMVPLQKGDYIVYDDAGAPHPMKKEVFGKIYKVTPKG